MSINTVCPSVFTTGFLIGDAGVTNTAVSDSLPVPTQVAGVNISAALEVKSVKGGLVIPRMTTAQRVAIVTPDNGMQVYDTTLTQNMYYVAGAWSNNPSGMLGVVYATGAITAAEFKGMFAAPKEIIAAQGANKVIKVHGFVLNLDYGAAQFTTGGVTSLQYGPVIEGGGPIITTAIAAASFNNAVADSVYSTANAAIVTTSLLSENLGVYLSNQTAAFAVGDSTFTYYIWYSVVTTA